MEQPNGSQQISVEVQRYDPDTGQSWRQQYKVPLEHGWSVLNVLTWIYENLDPSLGYYYSCRIGKCEGCDCIMNGSKVLACNTLAEGNMLLEPLPEFQVFRDLIPNRNKPRVASGGRGRVKI